MRRVLWILLWVILCSLSSASDEYVPVVVTNQQEAQVMLNRALRFLHGELGMTFKYPVVIYLVSGKELDKKIPYSPYRGMVVGLHSFRNGKHQIYMMKDRGRDEFFGTLCHEMTHAWQRDNNLNQDIYLTEGLAMWVQYKALIWDGAYTKAHNLHTYLADPVYGVGYRFVSSLEQMYGEKRVLEVIKKFRNIPKSFLPPPSENEEF